MICLQIKLYRYTGTCRVWFFCFSFCFHYSSLGIPYYVLLKWAEGYVVFLYGTEMLSFSKANQKKLDFFKCRKDRLHYFALKFSIYRGKHIHAAWLTSSKDFMDSHQLFVINETEHLPTMHSTADFLLRKNVVTIGQCTVAVSK